MHIPGRCTGHVQTNEPHCHGPYSSAYKRLGTEDSMSQLRQGDALPSTYRQTVLDRARSAWAFLDHSRISEGFKHNGVAQRLGGSEDNLLTAEVRPIWERLGMFRERLRIEQEVKAAVAAAPAEEVAAAVEALPEEKKEEARAASKQVEEKKA